jgi:Cdc6-like AAA superfamily ATPase
VDIKVSDVQSGVRDLQESAYQTTIERWLSPPDPSTNHSKAKDQKYQNTGRWFLESHEYTNWKANSNNSLWLHGIPGCGKTILSSTIIEDLRTTAILPASIVLYFYFDFNDASKQSFEKMVRSLISQLYRQHEQSRQHLHQLYSSCENGKEQPSTQLLVATLKSMLSDSKTRDLKIVLDALDECGTRKDLLDWLASREAQDLRLVLTSRKEEDIESSIGSWLAAASIVPIRQGPVDKDILAFIRSKMVEDKELQRWQDTPDVCTMVERKLMEKAGGM